MNTDFHKSNKYYILFQEVVRKNLYNRQDHIDFLCVKALNWCSGDSLDQKRAVEVLTHFSTYTKILQTCSTDTICQLSLIKNNPLLKKINITGTSSLSHIVRSMEKITDQKNKEILFNKIVSYLSSDYHSNNYIEDAYIQTLTNIIEHTSPKDYTDYIKKTPHFIVQENEWFFWGKYWETHTKNGENPLNLISQILPEISEKVAEKIFCSFYFKKILPDALQKNVLNDILNCFHASIPNFLTVFTSYLNEIKNTQSDELKIFKEYGDIFIEKQKIIHELKQHPIQNLMYIKKI